jgi:hypothetical protein
MEGTMSATQRASPCFLADRSIAAVDHAKPLRDIVRIFDIAVFDGNVLLERYFPQNAALGLVHVKPLVLSFDTDKLVRDAHAELYRSSHRDALASLWTLASCTHLLTSNGCKLYAFAQGVAIGGIVRYPYIGVSGTQRYIALARADFSVERGSGALLAEQVSVR